MVAYLITIILRHCYYVIYSCFVTCELLAVTRVVRSHFGTENKGQNRVARDLTKANLPGDLADVTQDQWVVAARQDQARQLCVTEEGVVAVSYLGSVQPPMSHEVLDDGGLRRWRE